MVVYWLLNKENCKDPFSWPDYAEVIDMDLSNEARVAGSGEKLICPC